MPTSCNVNCFVCIFGAGKSRSLVRRQTHFRHWHSHWLHLIFKFSTQESKTRFRFSNFHFPITCSLVGACQCLLFQCSKVRRTRSGTPHPPPPPPPKKRAPLPRLGRTSKFIATHRCRGRRLFYIFAFFMFCPAIKLCELGEWHKKYDKLAYYAYAVCASQCARSPCLCFSQCMCVVMGWMTV